MNVELDRPFELFELRKALAKMKRGTAPGRDKITVKMRANLPNPAYIPISLYQLSLVRGSATPHRMEDRPGHIYP